MTYLFDSDWEWESLYGGGDSDKDSNSFEGTPPFTVDSDEISDQAREVEPMPADPDVEWFMSKIAAALWQTDQETEAREGRCVSDSQIDGAE